MAMTIKASKGQVLYNLPKKRQRRRKRGRRRRQRRRRRLASCDAPSGARRDLPLDKNWQLHMKCNGGCIHIYGVLADCSSANFDHVGCPNVDQTQRAMDLCEGKTSCNLPLTSAFFGKDTSSCSSVSLGWGSAKGQVWVMWTCGSGTDVHTLYDGDGRCENIVTRKEQNKGLSKEEQLVQQAMNFGFPRFSSCAKQSPSSGVYFSNSNGDSAPPRVCTEEESKKFYSNHKHTWGLPADLMSKLKTFAAVMPGELLPRVMELGKDLLGGDVLQQLIKLAG